MFSFLQSPQAAAAQSGMSMSAAEPSALDDIALGCECADPALQVAMWGQDAEPLPTAVTASRVP